jgi:hypothetical protein
VAPRLQTATLCQTATNAILPSSHEMSILQNAELVQVSTLQMGPRPNYNSHIQFIVPMDATFLRYLSATVLRLELNQVIGFNWSEIGRAQLQLAEVKEDLRLETFGARPRRRNLNVVGSAGVPLGTVTVRCLNHSTLITAKRGSALL